MKAVVIVVLALVALAIASPASDASWRMYKAKFSKHYDSPAEESRRFLIFKRNMRRVLELNQVDSARHSWTKFSDMERSEILTPMQVPKNIVRTKITPRDDLPESYDWRSKGAVNEIKDQGQCGSCWAFCATASIESANFLKNQKLMSLAEQQIVDCDTQDSGCGGGWPQRAMDYVTQAGGQELESDYPYTAETGTCAADKTKFQGHVSKSYAFESNEEAIMEAVMQHGVVSIAIDAGKFNSYSLSLIHISQGIVR